MNKSDVIRQMAKQSQLPQTTCRKALDQMLAVIIQQVYHSDVVNIPPFGSFKVGFTAPRAYRHPQTGATLHKPAARQVVFSAAKQLKLAVNSSDSPKNASIM